MKESNKNLIIFFKGLLVFGSLYRRTRLNSVQVLKIHRFLNMPTKISSLKFLLRQNTPQRISPYLLLSPFVSFSVSLFGSRHLMAASSGFTTPTSACSTSDALSIGGIVSASDSLVLLYTTP